MTISVPKPLMVFSLVLTASLSLALQASEAKGHWIADAKGCKVFELDSLPHESITWSGACVHGFADGEGRLQWFLKGKPNGTYTGTLSAGQLAGTGLFEYANGARYEGGFYASEFDGQGVYTFANGNRFEGDFVEGISTRHGHLQLTDGQRFESDFISDLTNISPEYRVPTNLLVLCFPMDKDYRSVHMMRSPDYSRCNGQVKRMAWSSPGFLAPPALLVLCFNDEKQLSAVTLARSSGYPLYDDQAMRMTRIRAMGSQQGVGDPLPGCHMVGVVFAPDETDYFFSQN